MSTIRLILKKDKKSKTGEYPIYLRVADSNNKRAHFATGFFATEKQFDDRKDVGRFMQGRGVPAFKLLRREETGDVKEYTNKEANDKLTEIENRAREIIKKYNDDHIDWGFEQFRADFLNSPRRNLFLAFSQSVIEKEYRQQGRFKRVSIATDALRSLERFDKTLPKKSFQDITPAYIRDYIKFCHDCGNANNTIGMRLRELRCFYNIAIREKLVSQDLYPFSSGQRKDGKVKIPKIEQNKTDQYLPPESMDKLARATFTDPILDRTRHLYLFSYYCRGMNWKDMALLTEDSFYAATVIDDYADESEQEIMMQYKRSKTKNEILIQIDENIQNELDWFRNNTILYENYVLPIIMVRESPDKLDQYLEQKRKRANRVLKRIAKELNLPQSQQNITFYSARHSFAMTMKDVGIPVEIISEALGHQSVLTTRHYLAKFSTAKMAKATHIDLDAICEARKAKPQKRERTKKSRKP